MVLILMKMPTHEIKSDLLISSDTSFSTGRQTLMSHLEATYKGLNMSHDQTMLSSINTGQYSFLNQLNVYFLKFKNPKFGLFGLFGLEIQLRRASDY
jgi:hypothetical protein